MQKRLWMLIAMLLMPMHAQALNSSATISDGTTGFGLHLTLPLSDKLNMRFGANYYTFNLASQVNVLGYEYKVIFKSLDLLADWYPLDSQIRLTAGIIYNKNSVSTGTFFADPSYIQNNGIQFNMNDFGEIKINVAFRKFAPYLGIGYGNAIAQSERWTFSGDVGFLYQGTPAVSLENHNCKLGPWCEILVDPLLEKERNNLQAGFEKLKRYPIIRVGISYRF
jgi:outer membrane receptor protein involved in Fe transport